MNKNRALLLDRDGVINADIGYVGKPERFSFLPGLFPFLRAAREWGYRLAVLTNQSGVARGYFTRDDFNRLTAFMLNELRREAIEIDLVLACFEHRDASDPIYARESFWRKPQPGMVLEAIRRLKLDPLRSAFMGDKPSDMMAAINGGIRRRLWLTGEKVEASSGVDVVRNFDEALTLLKEPFV